MYKALTYVMIGEEKKPPGSKITNVEFKEAGQTPVNIKQLVDDGAISEDMDSELHKDHQPVVITQTSVQRFDPDTGQIVIDRSITAGG